MRRDRNKQVDQIGANLFAMEPELRTLEGMIAILRILGDADDAVDPACLAFLANFGGEALNTLSVSWHSSMENLRTS